MTLRGQGVLRNTWLGLGGRGSGRGWHDMCGGDGNLTADGLEGRAAAAGAAEVLKSEQERVVQCSSVASQHSDRPC